MAVQVFSKSSTIGFVRSASLILNNWSATGFGALFSAGHCALVLAHPSVSSGISKTFFPHGVFIAVSIGLV